MREIGADKEIIVGIRFWLGKSGSGKSYSLYRHLIREAEDNPAMNYLIIVPEQFTLQTQKDVLRLSPKHGILNIDILSFKRLAYRIFEEVGFKNARGVLIDDMGKNLILRRLAGELSDELVFLGSNIKKPGYINEVKSAISEFMQYGIGNRELEKLIKRAEKRPLLSSKLKELQLLYNSFNNYIKEKYVTSEELLDKVSDCIPESFKIKTSVISFDSFTGFTPVQYRVIKTLMATCPEMNFSILTDNNGIDRNEIIEEHELFYLSKKTLKTLEKISEGVNAERHPDFVIDRTVPVRYITANEEDRYRELESREISAFDPLTDRVINPKLIHLEQNIFRTPEKIYNGIESDDIRLISALNRTDEITRVAGAIAGLVRENNWSYHDIAVITGDIDSYMHICSRIFTLYDIPFFIDRNIPVLLNPFTEYLRAAVRVVSDNYSYPDIMRYLRSALTDISRDESDRLENYILAFGIRGRKQWNEHFIKRGRLFSREELEKLDESRERITETFNIFEADLGEGKGRYPVSRISLALYKLIVRNNTEEKLLRLSEEREREGDAIRAKEFSVIYEKVMELLDQLTGLLGDEEVSLKEYADLLDAGFSEIRIGVVPKSHDYVQIGDITRSRLKRIKALFVVGVNDGIIPKTSGKGGLISDVDREFLTGNEDGIDMAPTLRMRAYTQRLYLYMMLAKPEEKLFLSFSRINENGESLKPSYLIKKMRDMFQKLCFDYEGQDLESRIVNAKTAYRALAFDIQDFLAGFGKNSGQEKKKREIEYLTLFNIYKLNNTDDTGLRSLDELLNIAFTRDIYQRKTAINRAITSVIYSDLPTCSISSLEKYAACAYSHFLEYGLRLREREEFSIEARELGSAFHDALRYYGELLAERGLEWTGVSEQQRYRLADDAVERALANGKYGAIYADSRSSYLKERIKRFTRRNVDVLTGQLERGAFKPDRFEFSFNAGNDYEALNFSLTEDFRLSLKGIIDRIDTFEDEEGIYVKVIDYKSGNKSFDLQRVYDGLDLQLPVYLNAATEHAEKEHPGSKPVIPAGILYYHIDDPLVETEERLNDEELKKILFGEFRMKGLVNEDERVYRLFDRELGNGDHLRSDIVPVRLKTNLEPYADSGTVTTQEFKTITDYAGFKITEMGREILDGNISIDPHGDDKFNPCRYCSYKNICAYKGGTGSKGEAAAGRGEIIRKMEEAMGRDKE